MNARSQRKDRWTRLHRLLVAAGIVAAGSANASLIGDSVTARLVGFGAGVTVVNQFNPTATVGSHEEFSGSWTYAPLNQLWLVSLDLDASSFSITFNDVGSSSTHDLGGFTFIGLQLSDLDLGGAITGVTTLADNAGVQSIGFSDHGITVQWNAFEFRDAGGRPLSGGGSTFSIQTAPVISTVPEPASAILVGLGLLGLGAVRRRPH